MAFKKKNSETSSKNLGKAASKIPSMSERVQAFRDGFNKEMKGRGQVMAASEYRLPFLTRRYPTGMLSVDLALGGGFPGGGISQVAGPKNVGKSWTAWQVMRQLQYYLGDKMRALLAMTELRADRSQARRAGVSIAYSEEDIAEMEKARKENGLPAFTKEELDDLRAQTGIIDELHGISGEVLYDGILSAVEANVYHLIIIDSFGSIMSGAEAEAESLEEKQYGGASGVNTKFLRKLNAFLTMNDEFGQPRSVCVLGINQIRANIGGDPYKPLKTTGGHALDHGKFVDLWLQPGRPDLVTVKKMTPWGMQDVKEMIRKEVNWSIEKGKAGIHEGARGSYFYDFRINNADFYLDSIVVAHSLGLLDVSGSWLGIMDPATMDPEKPLLRAQGRDNLVAALHADSMQKVQEGAAEQSVMNVIRAAAFKKHNICITYDWE